MRIAPGKGRVCDVGMILQSLGRPTQLSLRSLSPIKDLTMKRSLTISYTNWLGAGAVPLMTKPINIVALKCMACRLSPFDSCPWGRRTGRAAVLEL